MRTLTLINIDTILEPPKCGKLLLLLLVEIDILEPGDPMVRNTPSVPIGFQNFDLHQ